jgi:S-(hydroxymethyl)glutathione dehydrogenase/alcohol dehydrogenase
MEMKGAVLWKADEPLALETITVSDLGPGNVVVKVIGSGVCGSDSHVMDGDIPVFPVPIVLGHEVAGIVVEVGSDVRTVKAGDHVILGWLPGCGRCVHCRNGEMRRCVSFGPGGREPGLPLKLTARGTPLNQMAQIGGFAEYSVVNERTCVKIRDDAPLEKACLIGCGTVTGYSAVFHQANVTPGSTAVVIGCGGVGLNVIQSLSLALASTIVAVDVNDYKLSTAAAFGATHLVNATLADPVAAVLDITGGTGADYGFEVVTTPATVEQCFRATRSGGVVTVVGIPKAGATITLPASPGKTIQSGGPSRPQWAVIPTLIDLYMSGKLKLDELISKERPLDEVNEAFTDLRSGEVSRTVLLPHE